MYILSYRRLFYVSLLCIKRPHLEQVTSDSLRIALRKYIFIKNNWIPKKIKCIIMSRNNKFTKTARVNDSCRVLLWRNRRLNSAVDVRLFQKWSMQLKSCLSNIHFSWGSCAVTLGSNGKLLIQKDQLKISALSHLQCFSNHKTRGDEDGGRDWCQAGRGQEPCEKPIKYSNISSLTLQYQHWHQIFQHPVKIEGGGGGWHHAQQHGEGDHHNLHVN